MEAPLCKLCSNRHWSRVCPKPAKIATAKERVKAIEARPVKPSEKGAAKKAKKTKRAKTKKVKRAAQAKKVTK